MKKEIEEEEKREWEGNKRDGWNVGRFFSWSKAPVSVSTFQFLSRCVFWELRKLGEILYRELISRKYREKGEKVNFIRARPRENPPSSFQSVQLSLKE